MILRMIASVTLLCGVVFWGGFLEANMAEAAPVDSKTLVIYYSWSGNTRNIATQIHHKVGGDLVELEVSPPYPSAYQDCLEEFKKERDSGRTDRKLMTHVENMEQYQVVYIGFPIWGGSIPPPIKTLLESRNWTGQTLIPFCSHGSGGAGQSFSDVEKLATGAKVLNGFSVRSTGGSSLSLDIEDWLKKITPNL